jgi:hypothetical protein
MAERTSWVSEKHETVSPPRWDPREINAAGGTGRNCKLGLGWTEYWSRVAAAGPPRFVPRRVSRDKGSLRRGRSGAAADRTRRSPAIFDAERRALPAHKKKGR